MSNGQLPDYLGPAPGHWTIVPFTDAFDDATSGNASVKQSDYLPEGALAIVDQGQEPVGGYTNDLSLTCGAELPCIVFGDHTRTFKYVDHPFAIGAQGTRVLVPVEGLDPRFAFHYLRQLRLPANGYSRHYKFLKRELVPLPPSDKEQQAVARVLDRAEAARAKQRRALARLDDFLAAVFDEMFGTLTVSNPGCIDITLGEVVDLFAGNSLPSGEPFSGQVGGYLLMKVGDMNLPGNLPYVTETRDWTENATSGITCPAGAVVFPKRGGSIATNKKGLLKRPALLDPNVMGVSPHHDAVHPVWLLHWFMRFDLVSISSGSSVPQLNKRDLDPLPLVVPPLSAQEDFANVVAQADSLRHRLLASGERLDALYASLAARAFRGELNLDPDGPPAE